MKPEPKIPVVAEPAVSTIAAETAATGSDSLRKELGEQKDLYLRLMADFENFKRRSRQEL